MSYLTKIRGPIYKLSELVYTLVKVGELGVAIAMVIVLLRVIPLIDKLQKTVQDVDKATISMNATVQQTSKVLNNVNTQITEVPKHLETTLDSEIVSTHKDLINQVSLFRSNINDQLTGTRSDLNIQLDETRAQLLTEIHPVLTKAITTLDDTDTTIKDSDLFVNQSKPFVIGTLAATKVTMGNVAKSSIVFNNEFPLISDNIGKGVKAGTVTLENLEKWTKPLPWFEQGMVDVLPGVGSFLGAYLKNNTKLVQIK